MEFVTFLLFAMTTFIVVITPGPAALTVASQASGNGIVRTQAGIAGVASANVVFFVLSATGISASIIASETLFTAIKWFGVLYLCYLGLSAILSSAGGLRLSQGQPTRIRELYGKGFLVEFANPKALLYFAAILPQFLDPTAPILQQFLIMGTVTLLFDFVAYTAYAVIGDRIAKSGVKPAVVRWFNRAAGGALLFAAFKMARVTS